jgi:hypothetical protein
MTQDEIVAMAREAHISAVFPASEKSLERFAKLVAQEVRDRIMFGSRDDWVLAEREACAKLCEEAGTVEQWDGLSEAADRIRARGEQA